MIQLPDVRFTTSCIIVSTKKYNGLHVFFSNSYFLNVNVSVFHDPSKFFRILNEQRNANHFVFKPAINSPHLIYVQHHHVAVYIDCLFICLC